MCSRFVQVHGSPARARRMTQLVFHEVASLALGSLCSWNLIIVTKDSTNTSSREVQLMSDVGGRTGSVRVACRAPLSLVTWLLGKLIRERTRAVKQERTSGGGTSHRLCDRPSSGRKRSQEKDTGEGEKSHHPPLPLHSSIGKVMTSRHSRLAGRPERELLSLFKSALFYRLRSPLGNLCPFLSTRRLSRTGPSAACPASSF